MPEARTFHSLGAKAWYKAHRKSTLAATAEEQEEAAEEAAADADDCAADEARAYTPRALCRTVRRRSPYPPQAPVQNAYVPNKSKMLLRLMYPKPAEDTSRSSLSLEVHLFESFVVKMVSLAKMEAVGIEGGRPDSSETWASLCDRHKLDEARGLTHRRLSPRCYLLSLLSHFTSSLACPHDPPPFLSARASSWSSRRGSPRRARRRRMRGGPLQCRGLRRA